MQLVLEEGAPRLCGALVIEEGSGPREGADAEVLRCQSVTTEGWSGVVEDG